MSKLGSGHLQAMLRQGLGELRGAMYTESNVAQQPGLGLVGVATPGEIQAQRGSNLGSGVRISSPQPDMSMEM